jgi:tetratricopeptide (TPR) repeat protein
MDLSTRQGRREQGQRIQRAVERAGLSVEELAGRIGCSRALIYQYLSGTTLAQPDRLQQIAAECGVPLTYFYSETEEREPGAAPGTPSPADAVTTSSSLATPQEVTARLTESLRALQELADAQESPPDYRALASTCERILSLSAQLGDRVAQARAQRRLGGAYLSVADYPRAAEALTRAVTLAAESGEIESETAARQSLGKALMAMGRYAEAREQFARVAAGPVFSGRWRGTLSLGGIHTMFGEYQQAMQRFDEAAAILEEGEISGQARPQEVAVALLYVNTNRRNVYLDGGDFRNARPLAERCLADAEALGNADQHLEARFDLAWCDYCTGRWSQAHRGLSTMLQLARFVGEQGFETMARAWLGIFLAAAGDQEAAVAHGKDALALALSRGDRRGELYAQLALADAYTGQTMREGEARYHTSQALAVTTAMRHDRGEIECRLRLARLSAQTGDLTEMRESASRALALSQRLGARHLESLARGWLALALLRAQQAAAGSAPESANPKSKSPGARSQPLSPELAAARREAEAAVEIARELEMIEARWRAHDALAQLALAERPASLAAAEGALRAAIADLERLRAALIEAGLPDTLLENEDCVAVYGRLARVLRQSGRAEEAEALLEQTGWPPLTARLAVEPGQASE